MNSIHSRICGDEQLECLPWPFQDTPPGRLLGIDAGGSATRVILVADGLVTRRYTAPPMNALLTADLTERLAALIGTADATAVGIGLPGMRSPEDAAALGAELTRRTCRPVRVTEDGQTALLGAFGDRPGIAVYAGTGSGALGNDGERWARAGGHGFLLGDEGSAYWIGRAAANAALRFEDETDRVSGMADASALRDAIVEASGHDMDALVKRVHSRPAERELLAGLAPVVTSLADRDETARRIADEAAGHLAELALAVRHRLGPLPVSGLGGVLRAPVIWDRFAQLTGAVRPLAPPELGAALLAGRAHA
ncbi:MAG: N-acetylglucosamine kinase [Trebonia sp.]